MSIYFLKVTEIKYFIVSFGGKKDKAIPVTGCGGP
jgi:hypothetical protein